MLACGKMHINAHGLPKQHRIRKACMRAQNASKLYHQIGLRRKCYHARRGGETADNRMNKDYYGQHQAYL
jgi:uncharacterized protein YaeQ